MSVQQKKETLTKKIVSFICQLVVLFHDETQTAFARVKIGDHFEIFKCRGSAFKKWVSHLLYRKTDQVLYKESYSAALNVIEAIAQFEGDQCTLHNRVAEHEGALFYDLTDPKWRAVKITDKGWGIDDKPPTLFRRFSHQAPQVEPVKGGDVNRLFDFINIEDAGTRLLILTHLISSYVPSIPHPILVFYGSQGSGKSTFSTILRKLVDPSILKLLTFPSGMDQLVQLFAHHWMIPLDNLSSLNMQQSNALCRAVTGEGSSKRMLYSDDDDIIYTFTRVIICNGINISGSQPDLMQRSLLIELGSITPEKRRSEKELWDKFEKARAEILGGAFDTLSKAMSIYPTVTLDSMARMADYCKWGFAITEALGNSGEDFLAAYKANGELQNEEVLNSNPVAEAVAMLMRGRDQWEGAPTELLQALNNMANLYTIATGTPMWPKAANSLTRRLNTLLPNLEEVGIHYEKRHGRENVITLTRVESKPVIPPTPKGDDTDGKDDNISTSFPTREPIMIRGPVEWDDVPELKLN